MKKCTTAQRLKEIMNLKNIKQIDILNKVQPLCEQWGIKMGSNDLSQYVTGKVEPSQKKLSVLAEALGTNEVWLMGYDVPMDYELNFDNAIPIELDDNTVNIPVLGVIKAGIPIEAQEEILEYIEIPKRWTLGGRKFYGLKISGDSMYPKYDENDIVIFEQLEDMSIANNKDCAVMVNGDDATFKKVLVNEQGVVLVPYNMAYDMMMFSPQDVIDKPVRIIGIAKEKRTKLD